MSDAVRVERGDHVATVILSRPGRRNAVDPATAEALALELRRLADWLELDGIRIGRRGDLAPALRKAVSVPGA